MTTSWFVNWLYVHRKPMWNSLSVLNGETSWTKWLHPDLGPNECTLYIQNAIKCYEMMGLSKTLMIYHILT